MSFLPLFASPLLIVCKIDVATLKKTRAQFQLYPLLPGEFPEEGVACSAAAFNGLLYMVSNLENPGKSCHGTSTLTYTRYCRQKKRHLPSCSTVLSWTRRNRYLCHSCEHSFPVPQRSRSYCEKHDVNALGLGRYAIFRVYMFNPSCIFFWFSRISPICSTQP